MDGCSLFSIGIIWVAPRPSSLLQAKGLGRESPVLELPGKNSSDVSVSVEGHGKD